MFLIEKYGKNVQFWIQIFLFIRGRFMRDNFVWVRDTIIPQSQAVVSILSPTAQFGLNVFEGIRCYWNSKDKALYAFRLEDHLQRLMDSCRLMSLIPPYSLERIVEILNQIIEANDFQEDTSVRITVFGDGQGTWNSCGPISMFVAPMAKSRTDLSRIPALSACVSSWERINDNVLPPRAKVGANYINGRYAHLQAKRDGYDLPIFLGMDRKVSEGAGACLFMLREGSLVTPPKTSSVLEGITRDTIMRLASELGIKVVERTIDRTELYLAQEIFLCGSAAEISPIVSVDGFRIGKGGPGEVTVQLLQQYLSITSGSDSRYPAWRTLVYQAS